MEQVRKSKSDACFPPNKDTIEDRISGVIGSFFVTGWLVSRKQPSFVNFTKVESHGFEKPASLCAQAIAWTASSILGADLKVFAM